MEECISSAKAWDYAYTMARSCQSVSETAVIPVLLCEPATYDASVQYSLSLKMVIHITAAYNAPLVTFM